METLYDILEVSQKASKEVIERAYKVLAKKYHPDLQTGENKKHAEEKMKKINYAYSILSDDEKRAEYDETLEEERNRLEQEKNIKMQNENYQNYVVQDDNYQNNYNYDNIQNNEEQTWRDYYASLSSKEQRKVRRNIEKSAQNEYRNLYEDYFRSLGYKVRHKWTWREIRILLIIILVIISLFGILWIIPSTHDWMIEIYNSNILVKIFVNIILGIIYGIGEFFKSIFKIKT